MLTELALHFIEKRTKELGWKNYEVHLRHVRALRGMNTLEAGSDLWILIEEQQQRNSSGTYWYPGSPMRIESYNGVFDLLDNKVNEQEHEHTGKITINNRLTRTIYVMFLQVTPKRKCRDGKKK